MFWTFFVRRNSLTWVTSRFIKIGRLSTNDDGGSENITKKNEFASFQTLSLLFGTNQFVKFKRLFLELNS